MWYSGLRGVVKIGMKQVFDCTIEVSREFEREFQRRIVPVTFDSIDCLTRHANGLCEVCLALVACLPLLADA